MKNLTVRQLEKACKNHAYILARTRDGEQVGLNCKVAPIAKRIKQPDSKRETDFISFSPCSFNEYLSKKVPFLTELNYK